MNPTIRPPVHPVAARVVAGFGAPYWARPRTPDLASCRASLARLEATIERVADARDRVELELEQALIAIELGKAVHHGR